MNDAASLRKLACQWLMLMTLGFVTARILAVENVAEPSLFKRYDRKWPAATPQPSPTFSANDRARWASVRALVDRGTFVIGKRVEDSSSPTGYRDEGILFEESYRSIDVVMNPETKEFFSTKPPLLTVIVAGEYWVLKKLFGWDIDKERWQVVCTILISLNVLPFAIYLRLFEKLIDRAQWTEAAKLFAFAAACAGTFLTTFSNTLNNHTPAAFAVLFALDPWFRKRDDAPISPFSILFSGLWLGFAASLDLPATALAGLLGLMLLRQSFGKAFLLWVGVGIPLILQTLINHLAIGEWEPIYAKFGGPWYEFAGSHWQKMQIQPPPPGIDFVREPKHVYAFHLLIGHHGWFSLTPIFLISLIGIAWPIGPSGTQKSVLSWKSLSVLTIVVAVVVFAFYVYKTNNYGGFTSGPRWLFWLTPLFLLHLPSGWMRLSSTVLGRGFAGLCLAVSVFSVSFPIMNPWRHPWLLQLLDYFNWVRY